MTQTSDQANAVVQITALSTAIAAAGPLNGASLATLAPLILAAQTADTAIDTAIASTDVLISTNGVAGVVAGGFGPTLATGLLAELASIQNQVTLLTLKGAIGRLLVNLEQATG